MNFLLEEQFKFAKEIENKENNNDEKKELVSKVEDFKRDNLESLLQLPPPTNPLNLNGEEEEVDVILARQIQMEEGKEA